MNLKTLLIAVMSLIAMTTMAQTEKTAYAVYCAGSDAENDPATLYFLAAEANPESDVTHNGQQITAVWSGQQVTATSSSDPGWNSYKGNIKRVIFEESFKNVRPASCYHWFYGFRNLTTITGLEYLNTESVTNMKEMFYGCNLLTALDLSSFNTKNVTGMSNMFYNCYSLNTLTFGGNFTTENVMYMSGMFYGCNILATLDLSCFKTEKVTNMSSMFIYCYNLKKIILGDGFTTENVTDMRYMFYDCSALTALNLSNFTTENVTDMSGMFNGCSALTDLNLSNFTTEKVTNYNNMFYKCNSLLSLDLRKANNGNSLLSTGSFRKRGMVIYLPGTADVSDNMFEENYVVTPNSSTSFTRTFTSGNMSTLCLPFAVNTEDVTAGTFYEFKGYDGNTVKFTKLTSGNTVANKAYLFKPSTGDMVTFTGAPIDGLPEMTEEAADGLYGVFTKKIFTLDEADKNIYYGWSAGSFVSIGRGATLNPGCAYLKLSQTNGAKNIVKAVFDDGTTGISEVNATDDNAPAYDLTGRRVTAGYKGIVIKNGKKVILH